MNTKKVLFLILICLIAILIIWIFVKLFITKDYILSYSEGSCFTDSQCGHIDGCGGGHGKCTSDPNINTISICDINLKHPSMRGYECGCLKFIGRCGWKK